MQQQISQQVSIDKLDYGLYPTNNKNAPYQLEIYHTEEQPTKNIGALNKNTGTFSFKVGDTVDVTPKTTISNGPLLTNIIPTPILLMLMSNSRKR